YWEAALALLDHLGALICLHPDLRLSDRLWQQMRCLSRRLQQVDHLGDLAPWQIRLELLITAVPSAARQTVTANLQLPQSSITRLAELATVEATLLAALPQCDRPSQYVYHLRPYDAETLLLLSVRHPQAIGDRIWRYLTTWSLVKAPLNGNDLRRLGYRPGPAYRTMLEALLAATLDGTLQSRAEAEAFILNRYPLAASS
ncbi:MAG: poly(A) polymerase, partial [Cyanobacteria bacterium P01_H01_bin.58]